MIHTLPVILILTLSSLATAERGKVSLLLVMYENPLQTLSTNSACEGYFGRTCDIIFRFCLSAGSADGIKAVKTCDMGTVQTAAFNDADPVMQFFEGQELDPSNHLHNPMEIPFDKWTGFLDMWLDILDEDFMTYDTIDQHAIQLKIMGGETIPLNLTAPHNYLTMSVTVTCTPAHAGPFCEPVDVNNATTHVPAAADLDDTGTPPTGLALNANDSYHVFSHVEDRADSNTTAGTSTHDTNPPEEPEDTGRQNGDLTVATGPASDSSPGSVETSAPENADPTPEPLRTSTPENAESSPEKVDSTPEPARTSTSENVESSPEKVDSTPEHAGTSAPNKLDSTLEHAGTSAPKQEDVTSREHIHDGNKQVEPTVNLYTTEEPTTPKQRSTPNPVKNTSRVRNRILVNTMAATVHTSSTTKKPTLSNFSGNPVERVVKGFRSGALQSEPVASSTTVHSSLVPTASALVLGTSGTAADQLGILSSDDSNEAGSFKQNRFQIYYIVLPVVLAVIALISFLAGTMCLKRKKRERAVEVPLCRWASEQKKVVFQ